MGYPGILETPEVIRRCRTGGEALESIFFLISSTNRSLMHQNGKKQVADSDPGYGNSARPL